MTRSQLTEAIAARLPALPRPQIDAVVNSVLDAMADALRRGERIEIRGFGSFAVKVRTARSGRNPKTGKQVTVPERRAISFTCGKELKARLNPGLGADELDEVTPRPTSVPRTALVEGGAEAPPPSRPAHDASAPRPFAG